VPNIPTQPSNTDKIRVDSVRISNFRSLRNVEVILGTTTLLVGMNNSGKTSFLRALHLALGTDRRLISSDDFYVEANGEEAEILIDVRIIPVEAGGGRTNTFDQAWIDSDFGGSGIIAIDSDDKEFVAFRTRVSHDVVKSDFVLERLSLTDWPSIDNWQEATAVGRVPRFGQLTSYFIDAQRDFVGDLRTRSSYLGKLLSKIEISSEEIAGLEERLRELNEDIVANSEVLSHIVEVLTALNRTVPAFGDGIEMTPVSKKIRDVTKGLDVQFADSSGSSFPLESHGMGTRSWASLLSFEAYVSWTAKLAETVQLPFHPILSLEEPESYLHPNAQRAVHDQIVQGIGQRIVSTHSPYIAGQANLGDIVHFSKTGTETLACRMPAEELLPEESRKIRREIMRTRGELLFAQAVVLFEGETEEQAFPMFARHHWGRHPFERGVSFVGVGGDGNYFPFIRILEALRIPWFIFGDGEPAAQACVNSALGKIGASLPHPNVFILPNGNAIEEYLLAEGYQAELKPAVMEYKRPFQNPQHEQAKLTEVTGWTDGELKDFLESHKTGMAPHWAHFIIDAGGPRAVPGVVKDLLNAIDTAIGASPVEPIQ